jgi:hypothetical protein
VVGFPPRQAGSNDFGIVVDKAALDEGSLANQLFHNHHYLSSRAATAGNKWHQ